MRQAFVFALVSFQQQRPPGYPDHNPRRLGRFYNLVTSALPSKFRDKTMYLVFKNNALNRPETAADDPPAVFADFHNRQKHQNRGGQNPP